MGAAVTSARDGTPYYYDGSFFTDSNLGEGEREGGKWKFEAMKNRSGAIVFERVLLKLNLPLSVITTLTRPHSYRHSAIYHLIHYDIKLDPITKNILC